MASVTAPGTAFWLGAATWSWLTSPYTLSALAAGALALAVSYFLSAAPAARDAKLRVVAGDVRRVGEAAFVFRASAPSLPDLLLDGATRRVIALHPKRRQPHVESTEVTEPTETTVQTERAIKTEPTVQTEPPELAERIQSTEPQPVAATPRRLSIALPLRSGLFCRDDFREQPIADVDDLRVLDRGLHFHGGRAVAVAVGPARQETLLQFNSRVAAEAFLDVLHRVKAPHKDRPDKISLFLTTFNVGNSQPPDDLSPWLGPAASADIVAIGAQECSYTATSSAGPPFQDRPTSSRTGSDISKASESSEAITEATPLLEGERSIDDSRSSISTSPRPAQAASATSGKDHWHALLASHVSEEEYECIAKLSAWDRCLTIFVRTELLPSVSRVRSDTANVGLGGVAGNKGAIGARFTVFDTDFVIINSHLAAHHKEVNRRNEDFASISSGLRALRDNPEVDVLASAVHHMFWMGDLNYRINLERDKVLDLVKDGKWEQLQEADQLLQEMDAGRAFQGFLEGKTDFPPTYRYEYGSRKYSDVKLRVPSYCDRILYRSLPGCKLELHEYKPADEILTSDHSPVSAVFTASLVHTSGTRDLEKIAADAAVQESRDLGLISPMMSPRSLSMRALIPSGLSGFSGGSGAQLQFKSLRASDLPEMDHGGRRIAVAKALYIHNHVGWKKHDELGAGQHADPYCTFHGDAVAELDEGIYKTRTVTASQNPVWEAEGIPGIDLISSESSVLQRRYVVITVKDEIPTRRDGTIGSAVLWLGGAGDGVGTGDSPVVFSLPIMLGGRRQGEVSGAYVVRKA